MRILVAGLIGGAIAAGLAAPASAQIPTVATDGTLAEPAAPPPAPPAPPPQPIIINTPGAQAGEGVPASGTAAPETGYYHTDDLGGPADTGGMPAGAVPEVHVVRSGDTLWDLCLAYFNNPWDWPRVWSYNPEITNPHWIYPGDEVRMRQPGSGPSSAPRSNGRGRVAASVRPEDRPIGLRQLAFVANDDLDLRFRIDGSTDEKLLLAAGDEVYLSYPKDRSPRVGMRYAIYLPRQTVRHPTRDEEVGAFVRVVGEVEVISAARGKRARGILVDTTDVIERGMAVGPVMRQFKDVASTPAETDLEAIIVAEVLSEELIGQLQVVLLDRGSADRLRVGNRLDVIRRGDAYPANMSPPAGIGQNDARYPARSVGELLVVQTGRHSAVAIVVGSDKELGVGDRARLSRTRNRRPE